MWSHVTTCGHNLHSLLYCSLHCFLLHFWFLSCLFTMPLAVVDHYKCGLCQSHTTLCYIEPLLQYSARKSGKRLIGFRLGWFEQGGHSLGERILWHQHSHSQVMLGGYCTCKLCTVLVSTAHYCCYKHEVTRCKPLPDRLSCNTSRGFLWGQPMGKETPHCLLGPC